MWLLTTGRAELKHFPTPESVPGGYAILSHCWTEHEQSFDDIRTLHTICAESGANPRSLASMKIRNFLRLAQKHGYQWVWIDTCCIDQRSSSELSEAINSMYRYYALAQVCYVYLADVPARDPESAHFRSSRWHTRGWTLQELIAPDVVVFLSMDWTVLGTKSDLADLLASVTHIPAAVLRLEQEHTDICIAARMSWASFRETTRPEDEAYCLMGIFDVNMPILYGEGRQAFRRLQEGIMKKTVDTSLFVWGSTWLESAPPDAASSSHDHVDDASYLLAPAPSAFRECHSVVLTTPRAPHRKNKVGSQLSDRLMN